MKKVKQEALKKTIRVGQKAGSHKCIFCIASRIGLKKVTGELIQCEPLLIAHVLHARASIDNTLQSYNTVSEIETEGFRGRAATLLTVQ